MERLLHETIKTILIMKKLSCILVVFLMALCANAQQMSILHEENENLENNNPSYGETPRQMAHSGDVALCPNENHPHFIDLGLPSGTLWACCNVGGSTKPDGYGGFYAWGETSAKSQYNWNTYKHCDGSKETCHDIGVSICDTQYDVAKAKWGSTWRMPSYNEFMELIFNCTYEYVSVNGVNGGMFTSKNNGRSVFLSTAGELNVAGFYWVGTKKQGSDPYAYFVNFNTEKVECYYGWSGFICTGYNVRPVASSMPVDYDEGGATTENAVKVEAPVKAEAPVRQNTPAKVETPAKQETPVKAETPAIQEAPVKAETPAIQETPVKTETPAPAVTPSESNTERVGTKMRDASEVKAAPSSKESMEKQTPTSRPRKKNTDKNIGGK